MTPAHIYRFALVILLLANRGLYAADVPGFTTDASGNLARTIYPEVGVRAVVHLPIDFSPSRPTQLILFALPNGNTIEQTIGCATVPGLDWHFDIQHIGAQIQALRELTPEQNVAVAYLEADGLSWPAWRAKRADAPAKIAGVVDAVIKLIPGKKPILTLSCHSGGGALLFSFFDAADAISSAVDRILFLDANYSYDDPAKHHGDKLLAWLKAEKSHRLIVIAYDDREITLNGKKVVGETGGTWRASGRMMDRFSKDVKLVATEPPAGGPPIVRHQAFDGRLRLILHRNPENKILHTRLVELNGMLESLSAGTSVEGKWKGTFFGDRAYSKFVQNLPCIPARWPDAPTGSELVKKWAKLAAVDRELAVEREILRGNFPSFIRQPAPVKLTATIDGKQTECVIQVAGDYLAVGSDTDFLRMPLTPPTATRIAATLGCTLPTKKMVDAVDSSASVKLEPRPMTQDRETLATFSQHNELIEAARAGKTGLICGIKKDVVLTNRLSEKTGRVAIYGWRKADGSPIQPLTTVHQARYVDYSHGIRLISRAVTVDGKERMVEDVLKELKLSALLSDEGPLLPGPAMYQP